MSKENDSIAQLKVVLSELAIDPRASVFPKVRHAVGLLGAALDQLEQQQSAILEVQSAIASELAEAILRNHYAKDLYNVEVLEALGNADMEAFRARFAERHS